jgi:type II secretory pathway pseudopilin PulG
MRHQHIPPCIEQQAPSAWLPRPGFVISELLVALSLLSVVSSISITKVMHAHQTQEIKHAMKDAMSTLSQLFQQDALQERLTDPNAFNVWLQTKVNALQYCPTNVTAEGCLAKAKTNVLPDPWWVTTNGFVFPNGTIVYLHLSQFPSNGIGTVLSVIKRRVSGLLGIPLLRQ